MSLRVCRVVFRFNFFNLLGITFAVNLDTMVEPSYNKAIDKVTKDVLKWQNRNLTPIERVTVIKSLLLQKIYPPIYIFANSKI